MADNSDQITEWNGVLGEKWAELQAELDALTRPFGNAALAAARVAPGEAVLDIGCGCGDTTFEIAGKVGPIGSVHGVDVSRPMLTVAGKRLKAEGLAQLTFAEADASAADLPANHDLLFSRFGVMFFDDPPAAFAHMRGSLKPTARLAFCCWRHPRENPWAVVPLSAARAALNMEAPPADPYAPGPFAFADAERLRGILSGARFTNIEINAYDHPVRLGATPAEAAENSIRFGPSGRFIREMGDSVLPTVLPAMAKALEPFQGKDGCAPPGAVWIVIAKAS